MQFFFLNPSILTNRVLKSEKYNTVVHKHISKCNRVRNNVIYVVYITWLIVNRTDKLLAIHEICFFFQRLR
jgi:hypothetical protein